VLHVHLDPLGGLAGDMFIAALLDAQPQLDGALSEALAACALPSGWAVVHGRRKTKGLDARTFDVVAPAGPTRASGRYAQLMERIDAMALPCAVRTRAKAIYTLLGDCEAHVHGIDMADVHFHELADWDSVVDIVVSAALIEALGSCTWSCSPLPLGGGQVRTAHGPLPVPAPATARLISGIKVHHDGIDGERVTPTGAAIAKHLELDGGGVPVGELRALASGLGAGQRELAGCANVLRAQIFEREVASSTAVQSESVSIVEFELDDLSPEALASGLDTLRATPGVIDVFSHTGFGKKQRVSFAVRVLCLPALREQVVAACMVQTTTLGVRVSEEMRYILSRRLTVVELEQGVVGVKLAQRPDGVLSAKAEHDDIEALSATQQERFAHGADAVTRALAQARQTFTDETRSKRAKPDDALEDLREP
jgi:pyridinium-3,5-bisthiocarboxylic acid mononucleotide nickel chelatase